MIVKECQLRSGSSCQLHQIRNDVIPNYYLVSFPKAFGEPSAEDLREILLFGINEARELANALTADPEAYTLVYSGYSARREKGWHVHIFLLGNRWKKAWLYFMLSLKNLAQGLGLRKDDAPKYDG